MKLGAGRALRGEGLGFCASVFRSAAPAAVDDRGGLDAFGRWRAPGGIIITPDGGRRQGVQAARGAKLGAALVAIVSYGALVAAELNRRLADDPSDLSSSWWIVVGLSLVCIMATAGLLIYWLEEASPSERPRRRIAFGLIGSAAAIGIYAVTAPAVLAVLNALVGLAVLLAALDVLSNLDASGNRIVDWWYRRETFPWLWILFWWFIAGVPGGLLTAVTDVYVWIVPYAIATNMLALRWLGARWRHLKERSPSQSSPRYEPLRELWLTNPLELLRHQAAAAGGGVFLGTGGNYWEFSRAEHSVLVLGPPRSGKTSSIVIPSLLCHDGPAVSTSTKTDVLQATAPMRRDLRPAKLREGEDYVGCYLFDPTGSTPMPDGAVALRWSPIVGCGDWLVARRRALSMVGAAQPESGRVTSEAHWTERAAALLAPLLHVAAVTGKDMGAVVGWINAHNLEPARHLLEEMPDGASPFANTAVAGFAETHPREMSAIWSVTSGVVACYQNDAALATTADPNFDAERWLTHHETIYIAANAEQQRLVAPIVVGLLDDLRRAVYAGHQSAGTTQQRALFALDECANIAPIHELPAMASEAGGQGLTLLACFQDLSQVAARWPQQASGFLTLFNTNAIFRGIKESSTLELVSKLFGEHEVERTSRNTPDRRLVSDVFTGLRGSQAPRPNTTFNLVRQRQVPFDEVARGVPGKVIVLDGAEAPEWITLSPAHGASPWLEISNKTLPTEPLPDDWLFHLPPEPQPTPEGAVSLVT